MAQLAGALVVLVACMFSGAQPTLQQFSEMPFPLPIIPALSFLRWSVEGLYLAEVFEYRHIYNIDSGMELLGYSVANFSLDLWILFVQGVVFRVLAGLALVLMDRDKRK